MDKIFTFTSIEQIDTLVDSTLNEKHPWYCQSYNLLFARKQQPLLLDELCYQHQEDHLLLLLNCLLIHLQGNSTWSGGS